MSDDEKLDIASALPKADGFFGKTYQSKQDYQSSLQPKVIPNQNIASPPPPPSKDD